MHGPNKLASYLTSYELNHQHPTNRLIHKVAVPSILFALVGLLAAVPVGPLNLAMLVLPVYALFCLSLSAVLGLRLAFALLVMAVLGWAVDTTWPGVLLPLCAGIFVLAWVAQFVGHHIEKRRPAFFTDLFFLLIGPLWTLETWRPTSLSQPQGPSRRDPPA